MKKILVSVMIIALVVGITGVGFAAYFSDTATSDSSTFTAGTIDLQTTGTGSVVAGMANMKPGDTTSGSWTLKNVGSLAGKLYATAWYDTADDTTNPVDKTDDEVAKMLLITAFTDNGNALPIADTDGDTRITVWDMVNAVGGVTLSDYPPASPGELGTWYLYDPDMQLNEQHIYAMTVQFDTAAGNGYQSDGINLTFKVLLTQQ